MIHPLETLLYVKSSGCPPCEVAKQLLERKGLGIPKCSVEDNEEILREAGIQGAPVLFHNGQVFTGQVVVQQLMKMKPSDVVKREP